MIIGGLEMKDCLRHTEDLQMDEQIQAQKVGRKWLKIQCTMWHSMQVKKKNCASLKNPSLFCLETKQMQVASTVINSSLKLVRE